jgi:hypothetical protein
MDTGERSQLEYGIEDSADTRQTRKEEMIYNGVLGTAINQATFISVMITNTDGRLSPTDVAFLTNFKVQLDASLNSTAQQDMQFKVIFDKWFMLHGAQKNYMQSSTSIVAGVVTSGGA